MCLWYKPETCTQGSLETYTACKQAEMVVCGVRGVFHVNTNLDTIKLQHGL